MSCLKYFLLFICVGYVSISLAQEGQTLVPLPPEVRENFVQKALQFRKEENYAIAIMQLDSILIQNPKDAGILLFKGDLKLQSKLYKEAVDTYKKLLVLNYETTTAQINLSYALFMNHQPANALNYAAQAWEQNKTNTNAIVNYFNAMLWNVKTNDAAAFLNQHQSSLTPAQVLVLKARLCTTSGDYRNGLKYYDSLVKAFPDKYYVQEYSEVLLGKKEMKQSAETMKASENLFSASEYKVFTQKLSAARFQNAGTEFVYFKDMAKNIRIENSVWWQQRDGHAYRFRVSAGSSALTSALNEKTNTQFAHLAINERWSKAWSGQTDIHLQRIKPGNGEAFFGLTGKQTVQYQPNDRRMIGLFYFSDILNYTASLLGNNIRSNNIGYVTHIMLSGKTGIYSQGSFGTLSDKNQQLQVFASLYHLLRTEPTLKVGLNMSALHYKENENKDYFSPNRYLSSEVFADYSTALPGTSRFYLQLQAAAGVQKIERQDLEPAFRFQSEIGYRLNHFETSIKYQTSNVASVTGTGYKFNWFTLRFIWKW